MGIRDHLRILHWFLPTSVLIRFSSQNIFLPFYHTISDHFLPHIGNLYSIRNVSLFKQDLDFLCKNYRPIDINELSSVIINKKMPDKPLMHFSFDDGLSEVYHVIAPLLEEKGIPATIFLNSSFIDNQELFYRYKISLILQDIKHKKEINPKVSKILIGSNYDEISKKLLAMTIHDLPVIEEIARVLNINFRQYLKEKQPYLTTNQIRDLKERGFTFGSHSANHPFFKNLSLKEKKEEIIDSVNFLREKKIIDQHFFSFPFSDEGVHKSFIEWLYDEQECKLSFGVSGLKRDFDPRHLHRTGMDKNFKSAKNVVKSEYLYYLIKSLFNRNTIKRI